MKKERTKGWLGLFGTLLILFYIGSVYRIGGFSAGFALVLLSGILAVPAVLLASYRRVGSLPAWATVAAAFPVLYLAAGDTATAALAWALLCGTPLAVTFSWPYYKKLAPLTSPALPLAGALWMGGALVYSKLHFGSWDVSAMTARIAERYTDTKRVQNGGKPGVVGVMVCLLQRHEGIAPRVINAVIKRERTMDSAACQHAVPEHAEAGVVLTGQIGLCANERPCGKAAGILVIQLLIIADRTGAVCLLQLFFEFRQMFLSGSSVFGIMKGFAVRSLHDREPCAFL